MGGKEKFRSGGDLLPRVVKTGFVLHRVWLDEKNEEALKEREGRDRGLCSY